jgi:O-methyltransferase involved in polyketide biosynthesis
LKASLPDYLRLPALTLAAHAYEHRRPGGIMSDHTAERWFQQLDQQYAVGWLERPHIELVNGIIVRSMVIDYAVLDFIATSQQRVVITDLGCGFSTREYRLNIYDSWIHLDLETVLQARLALQPKGSEEVSVAEDLTDLDNWHSEPARAPVKSLFILEGVLNHLARDHAKALLSLLRTRCRGGKVIGTVITENGLKGAQSLAADLGLSPAMWAVQDTDELLEFLDPIKVKIWLLGKVASQLGLIRPATGDEASGLVFLATL